MGATHPDPRTFTVRLTREQWRALPLHFVLIPVIDAPVLVFRPEEQPAAEVLKARIEEMWLAARKLRKSDPRRRGVLGAIKRFYRQRVDLACGYTWPGNPPGYIEFAAT